MSQRWSTSKFAMIMIPLIIFVGYIVSLFFDPLVVSAIIAVTAVISLILQYNWRGTDKGDYEHGENVDNGEDTDSQQSDAGYQTQPASLGGTSDDATTDSTPDTGDTPTPLKQSSLLRSNDEIIDEVEDKLDNYVQFYNDGSIEISDNDLNLYSRMMLQVIVKRLKYEYGSTDSPR